MVAPATVARHHDVETDMDDQRTRQRRTRPRPGWDGLTVEEKQQRLAALRHRQQHQIELELRMLHVGR
jgi:hypothetical protein